MAAISTVQHLFAGKPQAFGPKGSPSSIIKQSHTSLSIKRNGAIEDEQGNKKLHGGPFMAVHQYAQQNYVLLKEAFPNTPTPITLGSIGENISAPNMHESNVFIGDQYKIGSAILQVVSPRAPCAMINHRYGQRKIDLFIAEQALTGWYFSVLEEGDISVSDTITLVHRQAEPISVAQIWQLRKQSMPPNNIQETQFLLDKAINESTLAPEWQGYLQKLSIKLQKFKG